MECGDKKLASGEEQRHTGCSGAAWQPYIPRGYCTGGKLVDALVLTTCKRIDTGAIEWTSTMSSQSIVSLATEVGD
jgi:hypothetical protein